MKRSGIRLPGYTIDNKGKLKKSTNGVDVSKRIRQRKSRKITVKRG